MGTTVPLGLNPYAVILLAGVPIALLVLVLLLAIPALFTKIVVTEDAIVIRTPLKTMLKISKGDVKSVYIADLAKNRELRPTMRLYGAALFGYKIGWFRLANGHKAYVATYGGSDICVVIELRNGVYVLLSPKDFNMLVKALRDYGWLR